jgi:hypothetical protein
VPVYNFVIYLFICMGFDLAVGTRGLTDELAFVCALEPQRAKITLFGAAGPMLTDILFTTMPPSTRFKFKST